MESAYSGIFSIWSEVGAVGFWLYMALHIYPGVRVHRLVRRRAYDDPVQQWLAETYLLALCAFLLINILTDFFCMDYFVVGMWIWAGLVWNPAAANSPGAVRAAREKDELGVREGGQEFTPRVPRPISGCL